MIRTVILSLFIGAIVHDFHFSRTKTHYNESTNTLQVTINSFTDDLEFALAKEGSEFKIDLESTPVGDSLINSYIQQKLIVNQGGSPLKLNWIGYECDYDITYLYLESDTFSLNLPISIDQTLFMELYDDQENLIDFISKKVESSSILIESDHILEINE